MSPLSTEFPSSFVLPWRKLLQTHQRPRAKDHPNYHDANAIDSLITTSVPRSLCVGTGHSLFQRAILPAIASAKHSVHFVTCFWAPSPSLDELRETLLRLATSRSRPGEPLTTLHITIGFSSQSLLQKLLHTSSRDGKVYPPSDWARLGLPAEDTLRKGGIELTVKSLFFTPFSVMHPKYVIVDEARAWIPSCNVSWETWFEGCVEVEGQVVDRLLAFHERVWGARRNVGLKNEIELGRGGRATIEERDGDAHSLHEASSASPLNSDGGSSASQSVLFSRSDPTPTILLPSPHHRNPVFSFFPFLSQSNPPMTPLNAALLTLFSNARYEIRIVTPNITSWPVLEALLAALERGVDVQIRTSKNMMLLEQLVTACTTTAWCLKRFIKKYKKLVSQKRHNNNNDDDLESQWVQPGKLEIFYYKQLGERAGEEDEPVFSHFKMTAVDGEYLVLGSGNQDRASWWTSQEIGVLFYMPGFEERRLWERVLERRGEVVFRSTSES